MFEAVCIIVSVVVLSLYMPSYIKTDIKAAEQEEDTANEEEYSDDIKRAAEVGIVLGEGVRLEEVYDGHSKVIATR